MIDEVLTDQEDQLLGQLKSLFYYPPANYLTIADQNLATIPQERREDFIRILLTQLGFEQSQRRKFVVNSLFEQANLTNDQQELVTYEVATRGPNGSTTNLLPNTPNLSAISTTISQEVADQAKVFVQAEQAIKGFQAHIFEITTIGTYFDALKHLSAEDNQQLADSIKAFTASLESTGDNLFKYNPTIPSGIVDILKRAGIGTSLEKFQTLGEKLEFLSNLLGVGEALAQNQTLEAPIPDDQLRSALALTMYSYQQPTITRP